ncbi:MAG: hypothetical protein H6627_05355 [Calditrichae bacterium]|nr:hypothetical protein [Calditrichia bacterium]
MQKYVTFFFISISFLLSQKSDIIDSAAINQSTVSLWSYVHKQNLKSFDLNKYDLTGPDCRKRPGLSDGTMI